MQIELTPTLIDMYRETFEGALKPDWCWIVSGPAEASVFGSLAGLTAEVAYASPAPGRKSIAAHTAHLKYTLELTHQRLLGENPPADWPGSFEPGPAGAAGWVQLQQELRTAYDNVLTFYQRLRDQPIPDWLPIQAVGLVAMTGHNAYHLGAIRQLLLELRE
jgi:hypothetical protein